MERPNIVGRDKLALGHPPENILEILQNLLRRNWLFKESSMKVVVASLIFLVVPFFAISAPADCGKNIEEIFSGGNVPQADQIRSCVEDGSVEDKSYLQSLFLIGLLDFNTYDININDVLSDENSSSSYKSYLISNYVTKDIDLAEHYFLSSISKKSKYAHKDLAISIVKRNYDKIEKSSAFAGLYGVNYYLALSILDYSISQECAHNYIVIPSQYKKRIEKIFYESPYISQSYTFLKNVDCYKNSERSIDFIEKLGSTDGFFFTELSAYLNTVDYEQKNYSYANTLKWIENNLSLYSNSPLHWCLENISENLRKSEKCLKYAFFDDYVCSSYSEIGQESGSSEFVYGACRYAQIKKQR